jgi:hypothetical protein
MIRGLPMGQYDLIECQAVEYALTEVFSEWVVEDTSVVPGMGYGFIRVSVCVLFVCLLERRMHVCCGSAISLVVKGSPHLRCLSHVGSVVPAVVLQFATADVVDAAIQELDGAEIVLSEKKGDDGEDAGGSVLKLSRMHL